MYVRTHDRPPLCPSCGGPPGIGSPTGRCRECAAIRREAIHRLKKLLPLIARIGGVLAAIKRITDLSGALKADPDDWRGVSYQDEMRRVQHDMTVLEHEMDLVTDEWTVLLWTR